MEEKKFRVGDRIRVYFTIQEGDKKRETFFEGRVIAQKGEGKGKTFTVRKVTSNHIAIERIFPFHSPLIAKIEILEKAKKIRRAKLYYQRSLPRT